MNRAKTGKTKKFIFLLLLSAMLGLFSGIVAYLFSKTVSFVSDTRNAYGYIILILPFAGLLSVYLNRLLKTKDVSTNTVIDSSYNGKRVTPLILPAIFISSALTHLFGASAGREGAALQMGVGEAAVLDKLFKPKDEEREILTVCGLASVFSALFSAPFGAAIFALEVIIYKKRTFKAIVPVFASSYISYKLSSILGTKPERFSVTKEPLSYDLLWKVAAISVLVAMAGVLFIFAMKICGRIFKKAIPNEFMLIFIGGVVLVLLTAIVGNQSYNGSGINLIEEIFEHKKFNSYDFILKIVFTVISINVGFKGGEIVPSFSIGATLGAALAVLFNLEVTVGAAIGMAVMFNSVTKCPVATIILCWELFGLNGLLLCVVAVVISSVASGKYGIYKSNVNKISLLNLIKVKNK